MTLPIPFDFTVTEDRRGINFEGVEAGHPDPEGALNLHLRVARDHLVLSVWPVRGELARVSDQAGPNPGAAPGHPVSLRLRRLQDDDKDAPQQTTMWEFDPAARPEILEKVQDLFGLVINM